MTVRRWMLKNVDRCNSLLDLVDTATTRFNYEITPYWLWNDAQYIWDLQQEKKLERKYGR